jgi:Cellulase (glycosyl hydrolase family 5)
MLKPLRFIFSASTVRQSLFCLGLLSLLGLTLNLSACQAATAVPDGHYETRGGQIVTPAGVPYVAKGINVFFGRTVIPKIFEPFLPPPARYGERTDWKLTDTEIQKLKSQGYTTLRINKPDWKANSPRWFGDDEFLLQAKELSVRAAKNNMTVIVGWRPDDFINDKDHLLDSTDKQKALAFWKKAAAALKGYKNIFLTPINEMGLLAEESRWLKDTMDLIYTIRKAGSRQLIYLDDSNFGQGYVNGGKDASFLWRNAKKLIDYDKSLLSNSDVDGRLVADEHIYWAASKQNIVDAVVALRSVGYGVVFGEIGPFFKEETYRDGMAVGMEMKISTYLWSYDTLNENGDKFDWAYDDFTRNFVLN